MRPPLPELRDQAQGRWRSLLPMLGVAATFLDGKQRPCPICGGKDRYRFDDIDGHGTWICNVCGAGNGMTLVMRVNGLGFAEMAAKVREIIPDAPIGKSKPPRDDEKCRKAARDLWVSAIPVSGTMAEAYLRSRGCWTDPIQRTTELRFAEHVPGDVLPAMLALVRDAAGEPVNVHRTFLENARRAHRKMMPGAVPDGAAIRLVAASTHVGAAEGIETAIRAAARFSVPCWSLINSGNLAKFTPPAGIAQVSVFGDADMKYGGQAAAFALAHRLTCRREPIDCAVHIPGTLGTDWADADPAMVLAA